MTISSLALSPHGGSGGAPPLLHVGLVCLIALVALGAWLLVRRSRRGPR